MKSLFAIASGLLVGLFISGAILAGVAPFLPEQFRNSTTLGAGAGFVVFITAWAFWALGSGRAKE